MNVEILPGFACTDVQSPFYPDSVQTFVDHLEEAGVAVAHAPIRPDYVVKTKELSLTLPILEILANASLSVLTGLIVTYLSRRGAEARVGQVAVEIRVRDDERGGVTRTIRATGTAQEVLRILGTAEETPDSDA